jgi:hypothetical protein
VIIKEVNEEMVPQAKQFLASRKEFAYVTDWSPVFEYRWKLKQFPYGYVMLDNGNIVGFLGTIFSERTLGGERAIHCNLSAWIVDEDYRKGLGAKGKGVGRHLIDPVLNMKDVLITNLTPSPRSKVSCEKLGFETLDEKQVVIPVVLARFAVAFRGTRDLQFISEEAEISSYLIGRDRQIFEDHQNLRCKQFLVRESKQGEYCYFIATTSEIRRIVPRWKWLNLHLCYVGNINFFKKHVSFIEQQLWTRHRVALLRYDSRLISRRLSFLERRVPALRMIRPTVSRFHELDNIYTELVTYNKY